MDGPENLLFVGESEEFTASTEEWKARKREIYLVSPGMIAAGCGPPDGLPWM